MERVGGEALARDRSGVEQRASLDFAEKVAYPGAFARRPFDPLPAHGEAHPGEIPVPGGVSDQFARVGHEGMVPYRAPARRYCASE